MGSARLPGKVLLPFAGAPMLQRIVERVRRATRVSDIVVATSLAPENDAVEALCRSIGCRAHRGSESDVLARTLDAAGDADLVVRLTGDNPFVDGALVDDLFDFFRAAPTDYAANIENSGFPYGLYAEIVRTDCLRAAARDGDDEDREHVTWYVRRRKDAFRLRTMSSDVAYPDMPLTVDTPEDYRRLEPEFAARFAADPAFDYRSLARPPRARTAEKK
jgi:spore coat polysaccharide biosynthesis protein SpsF